MAGREYGYYQSNKKGVPNESDRVHKIWPTRGTSAPRSGKKHLRDIEVKFLALWDFAWHPPNMGIQLVKKMQRW
jgi:hypothetical protein